MRGIVWLGSAVAVLLVVGAAAIVLRGTAPDKATHPIAATPPAAAPVRLAAKPPAPAPKPPSFDVVTVDPHGQAVIAGRAEPGDRVTVFDGGKPLGEVTADARGEWVLVPNKPMTPGDRQLSLAATGKDGGPARRSADVVALSVVPAASAAGTTTALAVLLPGDATHPARVLQRPEAATPGEALALDSVETGADGGLALTGRADPGAAVRVYAGSQLLGSVTADAAGKWSLALADRPPPGGVELRLEELGGNGSVARRLATPLAPSPAAMLTTRSTYVVRHGNSLWLIARHFYGKGMRYTEIYHANEAQIRDPNRIYPGQQFKLPKS